MKLAEFAAVIAGTDPKRAALRAKIDDSFQSCPHGGSNGVAGFAIDNDFKHRIDVRRQGAVDDTAQRRRESVIG